MAITSPSFPLQQEQDASCHVFLPRKKIKTSELPLSSAQRSTIDTLHHTVKKKGVYDALRKTVWSEYTESVSLMISSLAAMCAAMCDKRLIHENQFNEPQCRMIDKPLIANWKTWPKLKPIAIHHYYPVTVVKRLL